MTPDQHRKIDALNAITVFPCQNGFIMNLAAYAKMHPENALTETQEHHIECLLWKYRRLLPSEIVPKSPPNQKAEENGKKQ